MKRERYQKISGVLFVAALITFMFVSSSNSQVFDFQWGAAGGGNGQFNQPIGIAIDSLGNVFVADSGNNRIQKFDLNGNYITAWGTYGNGNSQFEAPQGIGIDSTNSVYVADWFNNRVQKFDNNGAFITTWGPAFDSHRHI
jgi:DNA-binding beta-propeller fold protein YncE